MEVAVQQPKLTQKGLDDFQLVERARCGCQRAFTQLMERHQSSIHRMMYRMVRNTEDAADLTQEAFGKAFIRLGSYVPHYAFSTWLYKIAVNNCIDHVRKRRLQTLSIDEPLEHESDHDFSNTLRAATLDPEAKIIRQQRIEMIRDVLGYLSEKYRVMIQLRYFEELSYEEIADQQGLPLGTVKAQLFRAKELLHELLSRPGASAWIDERRRA